MYTKKVPIIKVSLETKINYFHKQNSIPIYYFSHFFFLRVILLSMKHKKGIFFFFRKYFLSSNIHSYFILAKKWLAILNFAWFIVSYYLLSNSWLFINLYESLVFIKLFYQRNQGLLSFPIYIL